MMSLQQWPSPPHALLLHQYVLARSKRMKRQLQFLLVNDQVFPMATYLKDGCRVGALQTCNVAYCLRHFPKPMRVRRVSLAYSQIPLSHNPKYCNQNLINSNTTSINRKQPLAKSMFTPKSHLPQYGYFRASYTIPGTDWQLTGHSRALERTGFWIPQLGVVLDAGVDLLTNAGASPKAILITHGHIDHCNALPMLLRHSTQDSPPVQVFAPQPIIHRLRSFAQLSWAVKVDIDDPLPEAYAPPPEAERRPEAGSALNGDLPFRFWRPCDETTSSTTLAVGKKGKTPLVVHCLKMFHRQCSTVGYLLSTPGHTIKKVRPDLVGANKQETGNNVQAARKRGEDVLVEVNQPEQPRLAFVLDTQIEALMETESPTAHKILSCPVIMIECTYLEDTMKEEARKRGHVCWCELLPFVAQSVQRRKEGDGMTKTWILVHFSLRYSDEQIVEFFLDEQQSKLSLEYHDPASPLDGEFKPRRPPDVVLWVDDGPKELWVEEVNDWAS